MLHGNPPRTGPSIPKTISTSHSLDKPDIASTGVMALLHSQQTAAPLSLIDLMITPSQSTSCLHPAHPLLPGHRTPLHFRMPMGRRSGGEWISSRSLAVEKAG